MLMGLTKKTGLFIILFYGWSQGVYATPFNNSSELKPLIKDLPSKMKEVVYKINPKIVVVEKPLTFYGAYDGNSNTLTLNKFITLNEEKLRRTLYHEIAHLYDQHTKDEIARPLISKMCNDLETNKSQSNDLCRSINQNLLKISKDPVFQSIFGARFDQYYVRSFENLIPERSPDHYEYKNERELFAVNFEYFMLDSEYKCKRPGQFNYFSHLFGSFDPFPNTQCDQVLPFIQMNMTEAKLINVNPSRVYRVDYLVAAADKNDISGGFGHAMLRLVVCAPKRQIINSDCLQDKDHHLVVTFRASVSDEQISNYKGLTGKYPSNQYLMDYQSIVEEYAQMQLRDLTFYPLNLSRLEIKNLISQMSLQFWSLERRYYFATNNCASEIVSLFRSALGRENLFTNSPFKPLEMSNWFYDTGLISDEKIEVEKSAEIYWQKTLDLVSPDKKIKFKDFLASDTHTRRETYKNALEKSANSKKISALAQLLEFRVHSRLSSKLNEDLALYIKEKEVVDLSKISEIVGVRNAGWIFANMNNHKSYGIPYQSEMDIVKNYLKNRTNSLDNELKALEVLVKKYENVSTPALDLARKKREESSQLLKEIKSF